MKKERIIDLWEDLFAIFVLICAAGNGMLWSHNSDLCFYISIAFNAIFGISGLILKIVYKIKAKSLFFLLTIFCLVALVITLIRHLG